MFRVQIRLEKPREKSTPSEGTYTNIGASQLGVEQSPCYQDVPGSNPARKTKGKKHALCFETYLCTPLLLLLPHLVFTVKTLISEGTYTKVETSWSPCYQDVRGSNLALRDILTYAATATLGFYRENFDFRRYLYHY